MDRPSCGAELASGGRCRGFALPGGRCWNHAPDRAEERRAARSKGGKLRAIEGRRKRLDNPRALAAFLSNLVHDLVEGKAEAELVKTVAYSISVQCKVLDLARHSDLEQLRDELRAELAALRRRRA
jgi:hypothetical protein